MQIFIFRRGKPWKWLHANYMEVNEMVQYAYSAYSAINRKDLRFHFSFGDNDNWVYTIRPKSWYKSWDKYPVVITPYGVEKLDCRLIDLM